MDSHEALKIYNSRVLTLNLVVAPQGSKEIDEDCDCDCACPAQVAVEPMKEVDVNPERYDVLPTILITMTLPQI